MQKDKQFVCEVCGQKTDMKDMGRYQDVCEHCCHYAEDFDEPMPDPHDQ